MTSLATQPPTRVVARAEAWGQATDISARSALVTILGDTVAPLGGTVWLGDLIALSEPFGFSERLVRTSMFRLAAEGWVVSERVGRQSRYSLTAYGREETRAAERRIYRRKAQVWDGVWTLVFLPDPGDTGETDSDDTDELIRHLRWRGFARMAGGVHAHPNDSVAETRHLLDRLGIDSPTPVAAARFDGDGPIAGRGFRADSGLAEAESAYRRFLDRYDQPSSTEPIPTEPGLAGLVEPVEAFALRTMLVHDLRRARLRDPDLPAALLPAGWVGHRAIERAADLYRSITDSAWYWIEDVTGLSVTTSDLVASRFTPEPQPEPEPGTESEEGSP